MSKKMHYKSDIEEIISHRYDFNFDFWTTADYRLLKGSPFSTLECVMYLLELKMKPTEPILSESAKLIISTWQKDGRFKLYPYGTIYPCQTIQAINVLSHMGYVFDERLQKSYQYLLNIQHKDGGWRCNKFSYGKGIETEFSNPFPTLIALNAFRFTHYLNNEPQLDKAVEFLLEHWEIRRPIGPCHYGIGTRFMQVEYPFRSYNLFLYVYVLSFYDKAKSDYRFVEALKVLKTKLIEGQIVVERVVSKLANLSFCKKGEPSKLATERYNEIISNYNSRK